MNTEKFESYKNAVYLVSLDFQWIEELLKIVIGASYEVIRRSVPPSIKFRPNRKMLEKESLGRLVSKYEEVSANNKLISELRSIASDRNFCAHQSFVLSLEEQGNPSYLERETRRLEKVRERSRACVTALLNEFQYFAETLHETPTITIERDAPLVLAPPS